MSVFNIHIVDNVNKAVGKIVSFLVLFIAVIIVYDVAARYIFDRPTKWVMETSEFAFSFNFLLGGAYTLLRDGHVRVDLFYARLSPLRRALVDLFTSAFFFLFIFLLFWEGAKMGFESIRMLERTQSPWHPYVFPVKLAVPMAGLLMLLQGIVKLVDDINMVLARFRRAIREQ